MIYSGKPISIPFPVLSASDGSDYTNDSSPPVVRIIQANKSSALATNAPTRLYDGIWIIDLLASEVASSLVSFSWKGGGIVSGLKTVAVETEFSSMPANFSSLSITPAGAVAVGTVSANAINAAAISIDAVDEISQGVNTLLSTLHGAGSWDNGGGGSVTELLNNVWKWTTTVSASSGQIRGDVTNWNLITRLWINYISNDGSDLSTWLKNIHVEDIIRVQQYDDATVWNSYKVTAVPIDHGTWVEVPVVVDTSAGVPAPPSGKNSFVGFFRVVAETDWTSTERSQIRYRLGINGTVNVPTAVIPNLDVVDANILYINGHAGAAQDLGTLFNDVIQPKPTLHIAGVNTTPAINFENSTNRFLTMIQQDGPVYHYSANALELAPTGSGGGGGPIGTVDANIMSINGSSEAAEQLSNLFIAYMSPLPSLHIHDINGVTDFLSGGGGGGGGGLSTIEIAEAVDLLLSQNHGTGSWQSYIVMKPPKPKCIW